MDKLALKGFKAFRLWPVTADTNSSYTTGEMINIDGAQSLSKEVTKSEYTIYADDDIYDTGSDFQYETLTVTSAELPLEIESLLSGGSYDETENRYTFKSTDIAPPYAVGYAARRLDGNYRQFIHYVGKLMSVNVSHDTRGDNNDIQPYELVFRCAARKADQKVRDTADGKTPEDLQFIAQVEQFPITTEG